MKSGFWFLNEPKKVGKKNEPLKMGWDVASSWQTREVKIRLKLNYF